VIPLPRPWLLAGALLIGSAVGQLAGVASTLVHARMQPEVVIALVVGIPSMIGLLVILLSGRRWATMVGAFILALAPGWFGALVAIRVASGG
jgi:Putative holin